MCQRMQIIDMKFYALYLLVKEKIHYAYSIIEQYIWGRYINISMCIKFWD